MEQPQKDVITRVEEWGRTQTQLNDSEVWSRTFNRGNMTQELNDAVTEYIGVSLYH
jgi:hypothetical protein